MPEKMQVVLDEDVSEILRQRAKKEGRSCSKEASMILRERFSSDSVHVNPENPTRSD